MVHGYADYLADKDSILTDNTVWSGFNFLVGFLIVFRTSQAYTRFWDGATATHRMRAEWFDATSALVAFCKHSENKEVVIAFQQTLIRLVSILHAVALGEVEDSNSNSHSDIAAFSFELLDAGSIDAKSMDTLKNCHAKTELVFQWIQQLVVENIRTGCLTIPPPILSRCFQEFANGMICAHDAIKISSIPFPFPYAQTCDCLLLMHWVFSPLLVSQWVTQPYMAAIFCFTQVFIMWALNQIAVEIENPFGHDANDLDGEAMQLELNEQLLLLVDPNTLKTPYLTTMIQVGEQEEAFLKTRSSGRITLLESWKSTNEAAQAAYDPDGDSNDADDLAYSSEGHDRPATVMKVGSAEVTVVRSVRRLSSKASLVSANPRGSRQGSANPRWSAQQNQPGSPRNAEGDGKNMSDCSAIVLNAASDDERLHSSNKNGFGDKAETESHKGHQDSKDGYLAEIDEASERDNLERQSAAKAVPSSTFQGYSVAPAGAVARGHSRERLANEGDPPSSPAFPMPHG